MSDLITEFLYTDFDEPVVLKKTFAIMNVSYFDHFLSEEEYAQATIISYADIGSYPEKQKQFKAIQHQFISFYQQLFDLAVGNVMVFIDKQPQKISDYEAYKLHVINAMKEKPLCSLLYPSLNMFVITGYDLTHQLFISKQSELNIKKQEQLFTGIANKSGLFVI